ncbi:MAG: NnrU protein [SAR86 cluster bacterium]|uniref:NnrU protein n=1 Tax=SAR86 cluster bacterium TaxID=2030880 RepID=A0A2A5AUY0_9GAMM|nr:MAG: NnrU protein [SAR86 cluster bacterium]
MELLITGLILWSGLHFIPCVGISFRKRLVTKLGGGTYAIIFALLVVSSIVIMVFGWRSIEPVYLYFLPVWSRQVTILLVLLTFILFSAARAKTNIKRFIRHPQLTGLVVWGAGHLLSNGDSRSLVLFGSLSVWAIVEMILINKREGKWIRPEQATLKSEVSMVAKGLVMFAVFMFAHPFLTGISIITR